MSRKDDYRAHLASEAWGEIKAAAKLQTDGLCAFCDRPAEAVHHVRYPKSFADDTPRNTQPVCKRCHELAHGRSPAMHKLTVVKKMREVTPVGTEAAYLVVDGTPWGSVDAWCRSLKFPNRGMLDALMITATVHVEKMRGSAACAEYQGVRVYTWDVVAQALRAADAKFQRWKSDSTHIRAETYNGQDTTQWEEWAACYDALFIWGSGLQSRALVAHAHDIRKSTSVATVNQAVDQAIGALRDGFVEHDQRIGQVERLTYRDPGEFISAKVAVREKGFDEAAMPLYPNDRRNWAGLLGARLADAGAVRGPESPVRLDGYAATKMVNSWRRADAYAAIDSILSSVAGQASA